MYDWRVEIVKIGCGFQKLESKVCQLPFRKIPFFSRKRVQISSLSEFHDQVDFGGVLKVSITSDDVIME
jgi:hypothetical protein